MLVWNLLRVAKEQWWLGDLSSLVNPIPSFWQSFDDLKSFVYFILHVLHLYFCKIRSMVALYFCIYQSWILVAFLLCVFWLKYSFKWVLLCASGHFSDFIKLFFWLPTGLSDSDDFCPFLKQLQFKPFVSLLTFQRHCVFLAG